jgi:hypothetical protein
MSFQAKLQASLEAIAQTPEKEQPEASAKAKKANPLPRK